MPYTLPPIALTEGQTSLVTIPGSLGSVTYLKLVNASPFLVQLNNLLGGSDYMQPGEANVWPVPGLTTAVQVTPQQFGINPAIIPSSLLVVTWYLEGEQPNGGYPVNFNTLNYVGNNSVTNSPANVFEQDLLTPFVYTGYVATKDGSISNQLDVTAGVAFLRQATDSSLLRIANDASVFLTTTPSTTYFLDLNPDGSWSWATSHSGVTNHLTIASATTDGSGNISAVTDARTLNTTLLSATSGALFMPEPIVTYPSAYGWHFGGSNPNAFEPIMDIVPNGASVFVRWWLAYNGGDGHLQFQNTTGNVDALDIDGNGNFSFAGALSGLGGQTAVGSFGVPVIVAQAINTHITVTTQVTVLTYTPSVTGLYRISGSIISNNGGTNKPVFGYSFTGGNSGVNPGVVDFCAPNGSTQNGSQTNAPNFEVNLTPQTFYAAGGAAITVIYQNNSGTPSDHATAIIERLS